MKTNKLNALRSIAFTALIAVIGFAFITCDDGNNNNEDKGSGQFSGTDVKGNTYSLSVGSDASRAAKKGDRFNMNITVGGSQKTVDGTVEEISTDGTLTLKADGSAETFTTVVGGSAVKSVTSDNDNLTIPVSGGTFTPRTFDTIYLRANRWTYTDDPADNPQSGEQYASGNTILLKDFASNVTKMEQDTQGRYFITISGTSNVKLDHISIEIQGITNGIWHYIGGNETTDVVNANQPFNLAIPINIWEESGNLSAYDEVLCQITEIFKYSSTAHPESNKNYGTIPPVIPNGQITATLSNFSIVFFDTNELGNLGSYVPGDDENGNPAYQQARWNDIPANVLATAQANGKMVIEFGADITGEELVLVWQSADLNKWWEDSDLCTKSGETVTGFVSGVTYNSGTKTLTIDLATVLKDYATFKTLTSANLVLGCWSVANITEEIGIKSANITN